jgi:membrane fusion protein, multidrug efflux system
VAVGLTAAGVAVATGAVGSDGDDGAGAAATAGQPASAEVTRTDLIDTDDVDGSLGYGDPTSLGNRRQGTVTWVPVEGQVLTRGQALWRVDTRPTVLMYGSLPLYRTLRSGVDGDDVRQLETNLRALGYTGFTVDDEYTAATASAVKQWQDDVGLRETGSVDAEQVVFAPGAVRVDTRKVTVGAAAAPGAALDVTGTTRVVSIDLDVSDQRLARKGATVQVELPTGERVPGKITSVGNVAHAEEDQRGNYTGNATLDVVVTLDAKAAAAAKGAIDRSPVTVWFTAEERKNVLSVPVAALLALNEGGYGVQVVTPDGTTSIVAVTVGLFADGRVEVTGNGIAPGVKVGVPA